MSSRIRITIREDLDEEYLMAALSRIIEATAYPGIPYRKEGTFDHQWGIDSHNDWSARIVRKGGVLEIGEQPLEHDILEVIYRYGSEPLEALKPWLEFKFGSKNSKINLLNAGQEVDEEDYVCELDKVCKRMGELVRAQQAGRQEAVLEKLRAEMARLRPHAKRLLTGDNTNSAQ